MSCARFFVVVQLTDAASVCGLGMDRISDPYVRPDIRQPRILGQGFRRDFRPLFCSTKCLIA